MKRAWLLGSISAAFFVLPPVLVACHPGQPKQASSPDDGITDDSSGSSGSGGSSSSGGSSNGGMRNDNLAPPPGPAGKAVKGEATPVTSLASMMDGLRWGMSHADVTKMFTENGGILWKDYDARLSKARVGPEMTAIEAEREGAKSAFSRSFIEFKDTPTGYDQTGIKGEYTYRNRESLMWVQRDGKPKRYFFFINDRLWKIYDEVKLSDGGALGKSYIDAVNKMNANLGAQGRIQGADPDKGVSATTVDWKDGSSHLRVVDRSSGDGVAAVVLEENDTLGRLSSLRSNKPDDPTAIDPTIAAVTKGGLSDPNAAKTSPSASASSGKKTPPKKKQ